MVACSSSPPIPTPYTRRSDIEIANVPPATPTTAKEIVAIGQLPAEDETCVGCHTSAEQLQETVKPEEVQESLSEGEG